MKASFIHVKKDRYLLFLFDSDVTNLPRTVYQAFKPDLFAIRSNYNNCIVVGCGKKADDYHAAYQGEDATVDNNEKDGGDCRLKYLRVSMRRL